MKAKRRYSSLCLAKTTIVITAVHINKRFSHLLARFSRVYQFNEAGDVIEAFNLADEREGGHFDENMNYVFKKEKGEVDAWVAEMDEVAMEQAIGEAQRAVKRKAAEREEEERREAAKEFKTSIQLKKELLTLMQPKETVASAMRRLSGKAGKCGCRIATAGQFHLSSTLALSHHVF